MLEQAATDGTPAGNIIHMCETQTTLQCARKCVANTQCDHVTITTKAKGKYTCELLKKTNPGSKNTFILD